MKYSTIYLDPPWHPPGGLTKGWSGTRESDYYPLMKIKEIMALPVSDLALEDAHMWLWVRSMQLEDGLACMKHWGFTYKTNVSWGKPNGRGPGVYVRTDHELCLFGTRGKPKLPAKINGKRPAVSSLLIANRRKHSQKPDEMYDLIEKVSPGPYLEMFARNKHPGWHSWGNEVPNDVEIFD